MNISRIPAIVCVGLVLVTAPTRAHHSFATHYDRSNVVEITGVLTDVKMRNPHSFFEVEVTNENGDKEIWASEAHAVPLLRRLGITRNTLKVGDIVTIRGPRSRRPEKLLLFGAQITTSSGQAFEMLDSIRKAPENRIADARTGITGIDRLTGKWLTFITGQKVADSPMPLNDAGRKARENFDPLINAASECIPPNLPSVLMIPYIYEITRDEDTVSIFHEYSKLHRPVTLGSDTPTVTDPTFGKRIGRYEDDTLIIESSEFPAMTAGLASGWEPNGNGADIPSSEQKYFVERYTVNDNGSELTVEYTVTDPAYLREPYTAEIVWHRVPDDSEIYEFNCDSEIAKRSTLNAAPRDL